MENSPRLYSELVALCGQPGQWRDVRHLQTLAWMVVGLIQAECVKLTAWVPFVQGRARYAQSTQRRFRRWLGNRRIEVAPLYGPLIEQALQEWGTHTLYLALDTSMLWNQYCLIRLSVVYRGRAVPVVWEVIEHGSSSVTHEAYAALLDAVPALLPAGVKVVFLADRGFADTSSWRICGAWGGTSAFASKPRSVSCVRASPPVKLKISPWLPGGRCSCTTWRLPQSIRAGLVGLGPPQQYRGVLVYRE